MKNLLLFCLFLTSTASLAQSNLDSLFRKATGKGLTKYELNDARKAELDSVRLKANQAAMTDSLAARPPTITSLASLTASSRSKVQYDGDTWVKVSGVTSTTTAGYPGYVVPAAGSYHYERDRRGLGVNVLKMGAVDDSTVNSTIGFTRARTYALAVGTYVWIPQIKQKYLLDPQQFSSNEKIYGDNAYIKRSSTRGYAFWGNVSNTVLKGVIIDCEDSQYEGAYYITGTGNQFLDFKVHNGNQTSIVVSGAIFNSGGTYALTRDNVVKNGEVTGQELYHDGGGKAPVIAGDYAKNTTFENITARNNGVGISLDDFDSDNADSTTFKNCHVKNAVQREGAGFYAEGEQTGLHSVFVLNCTVINKRIGAAASENAHMYVNGLNAALCRNAINGLNNTYELVAENVHAIKCGNSLGSSDTEGVYSFSGPGALLNCTADSTIARYSIVNYSGSSGSGILRIEGGSYDARIQVAYENKGNKFVFIRNVRLNGNINWQQASGTSDRQVIIDGLIMTNGQITGVRIGRATIDNSLLFALNNTQIGVDLNTTQSNTLIRNTHFSGYLNITNYAESGFGITYDNIVNPPGTVAQNPALYVQGTNAQSRAEARTEATDDTPSGFATINAVPGVTGYPVDPYSALNIWYRFRNRMNHPAGEYWVYDQIANLNGSWIGATFRSGYANTWFPDIRFLTDQAMSGLGAGHVPYYDGANWSNKKLATTDIVSAPVTVTTTSATATVGTQIITNNASRVTVALPLNANSSIGNTVEVMGLGGGGWKVTQPEAGTIIHHLTTSTTGTSGYVQSGAQYDTITLKKIAANEWAVTSYRGTLTVN